MLTQQDILAFVVPIIQLVVYGVVGIVVCGGLWYYLFVLKRRRFWLVDVYEQKSDGKLYLVDKDRLSEKKINHGKQTIYVFRKTKTEAIPPPNECVRRLGKKEYCDYIRILGEYIPIKKNDSIPNLKDLEEKKKLKEKVTKWLEEIRKVPTTLFKATGVENKFIYIPLYKALKYDIDFEPISYDVNMMRINEIDSLDTMFQQKMDFWQKWGPLISIGFVVVLIIVTMYMGFEFIQLSIDKSLGAADRVAKPLEALVNKIGGSAPIT